ncbi:hypothetical protein [Streptomyces sp. ALI-76-A]|jgi:hypothetical protein|uniref:hypothetical protein n=1 Tax=Streptomyces sp. ALI-76-A TaxID=3025736 RepID=UPI00256F13CF|nr:hypothetical protein [Streptomyces sp. ALI-76-A]MDL5202742.1 hypothetical protein [Streptomyces sp. ALI-76-A]
MNRSRKAAVLAGIAAAGTIAVSGPPQETPRAAGHGRELWGAVTIAPGREGIVEVGVHEGTPPALRGPALALPAGPGRLQATATLNGVSATSEQIDITVSATER